MNNKRYYLSIVDDCSRYTWIFSLTSKSDAFLVFIKFLKLVEKLFTLPIKSIQTDAREGIYLVK
jgi:hypothetical protein